MGNYDWEEELENAILETGIPIKIQTSTGQILQLFGNVKWVHYSVYVKPDIRLDSGDAVVFIPYNITGWEDDDFIIIRNKTLKIAYSESYFYRQDPDTDNEKMYYVLYCQHPHNYEYQQEDDGYSITGDDVYYREWTDYNIGKLRLFDRIRMYDRYRRTVLEPGEIIEVPSFVEHFEMARPWLIEGFDPSWVLGPEAQYVVFTELFPQDWRELEPTFVVSFTESFTTGW